jgi:glycosyltransferase involved in cell wall biosynthesis
MPTIALCMIAKNEELLIKNAIDSVKSIVDEIIVVDTGSTDKTKEIAKTCGATVYDFVWKNDFAEAKNFAKEKATADWILFLDADECMSKQDILDIKKVIERESNTAENNETPESEEKKEVVAFAFVSRHYTDKRDKETYTQWKALSKEEKEQLMNDFPIFASFDGYYDILYITRLFKNTPRIFFAGEVHEDVTPSINTWDQEDPKKLIVQCSMPIHHLHFLKGEDYVEQKQKRYFELSKEKFKQAPDAKIALDLAVGYLLFEKNSAQSFHYLKEAIKLQPNYNVQRLDVVEALLAKKHDLRALHELMAMLDLSKHDFNSILNLAKAYYQIKAYCAAIVVLKRLLVAVPHDPVIIEHLGVCYDHIKYYDDAIKVFEHGIAVHPTHAVFYFNLGALYEKVKAWDKAIAAFQYAINNEHPLKAQLPARIQMLRNIAQGKHVQYNINIGDV